MTIRIVIVDDHTLVRSGFRLLLEKVEDFEVVDEAGGAEAALKLIAAHQPDVVVTDIQMEGMTGIDLTREVVKNWPAVRCIVLSMHKSGPYVKSALAAGASGYLVKDSVAVEMELAVRAVMRGESYLSPSVASLMIDNANHPSGGGGPVSALTRRQTEVLRMIAQGDSTKEIALKLGLSPKTIETHRAELMKRLDIFDVAGLVRFAIREGLVGLD